MAELSAIDTQISPVEKFREYLATRGKRLTREREFIVEYVFSTHEHFDSDQLVKRLDENNDGISVSRATVYRTLKQLVKAGLLRKVARPNGRDVYEHDYGYPQHDHLVCNKCGTLIEFHNDEISTIVEQLAAAEGFITSSHRLEVYGLCRDCSKPQRKRHKKLELM